MSFYSLRFYLYIWQKERQREGVAEAEADSLLSKEPDAERDPRTLGSAPELKADTQPRHPGAPIIDVLSQNTGYKLKSIWAKCVKSC